MKREQMELVERYLNIYDARKEVVGRGTEDTLGVGNDDEIELVLRKTFLSNRYYFDPRKGRRNPVNFRELYPY